MTPARLVTALGEAYEDACDPGAAVSMAAYMRDQFPFFGINAPRRRAIDRQVSREMRSPTEAEVRAVAEACWSRPEREFQLFAIDYLAAHVDACRGASVPWSRKLITTRSWWDTVDALAAHFVGGLVLRHRSQVAVMDRWIDEDDIWLARTAILHQLRWKEHTDVERLFDYCRRRAPDTEFFIRKAIGWALREYSKTDPDAVSRFVERHEDELSGLSRREALKVIERRRGGPRSRP